MDREKRLKQNIAILKSTPKLVRTFFENLIEIVDFPQGNQDEWSVFDVLGHLIHGEEDDWITRIKIILYAEDKTFTTFDRFAMFEKSKGKSVMDLVYEFENLRSLNINELERLVTPDNLLLKGIHPSLGEVNLDQLINTWVIHDLSHFTQIIRFLASDYVDLVGPWIEYLRILKEKR